jgi:cytosine/adenosine deaminase-related metal-dependent hydrolase
VRDPVKNLVYYAAMEDLDTVFIDGTVVVEDGTVLHADEREVARRLQLWPQMAGHD